MRAPAVAMLLTGLLAACSTQQPTEPEGIGQPASAAVATVVRGSIVSVVTIDAAIVATPEFVVPAMATAAVTDMTKLRPGDAVIAGQVIARQGDASLTVPADGYFSEWLVPPGVKIHEGIPVASIRYAGFAATGSVPGSYAYRLYEGPTAARVQITNGPGPQSCLLLAPSGKPAQGTESGPQPFPVLCALGPEAKAHTGLSAIVGLTTGQRQNVLLLPAAAVAGSAENGTVRKLVGGKPTDTAVKLGITDGVNVEIVSGLAEGDQVLAYTDGLRAQVPGTQ